MPPSPSVSVSQSVNQRWRERPRCPASRVTPGRRDGVVHAIVGRVACRCLRAQVVQRRTRRPRARVRVQIRRDECGGRIAQEMGSRASPMFPGRSATSCGSEIQASHHRAFHAGAVLSVVNALRFASTRPAAGPSGIDDASARHDLGYCAMVGFLMTRAAEKSELTPGFPQAYVDVSRLCPTAHPPHRHPVHAERVSSRRPQGTDRAQPPQHRSQAATTSRCA